MTVYQPVPAPKYADEYEALLAAGVLIDVGGAPLVPRPCETCDQHTVGATCPATLECPVCRSTRRRCLRPSGHEAADWCRARREAAAAIDDEREAVGDLTVPARWPASRPEQTRLFA